MTKKKKKPTPQMKREHDPKETVKKKEEEDDDDDGDDDDDTERRSTIDVENPTDSSSSSPQLPAPAPPKDEKESTAAAAEKILNEMDNSTGPRRCAHCRRCCGRLGGYVESTKSGFKKAKSIVSPFYESKLPIGIFLVLALSTIFAAESISAFCRVLFPVNWVDGVATLGITVVIFFPGVYIWRHQLPMLLGGGGVATTAAPTTDGGAEKGGAPIKSVVVPIAAVAGAIRGAYQQDKDDTADNNDSVSTPSRPLSHPPPRYLYGPPPTPPLHPHPPDYLTGGYPMIPAGAYYHPHPYATLPQHAPISAALSVSAKAETLTAPSSKKHNPRNSVTPTVDKPREGPRQRGKSRGRTPRSTTATAAAVAAPSGRIA